MVTTYWKNKSRDIWKYVSGKLPTYHTVLLVSFGAFHYFVLPAKLMFQNGIWQGAGVNTTSFCAVPRHWFLGINCGRTLNNLIELLDDANVTWLQKEEVTEGSFLLQIRWRKGWIYRAHVKWGGGGCRVSPFFSLNSWRLVWITYLNYI